MSQGKPEYEAVPVVDWARLDSLETVQYRTEITHEPTQGSRLRLWIVDANLRPHAVDHERTRRSYCEPGDAATSLRHLLNALEAARTKGDKP
jgi:hypothetical protein